MFHVFIRYFKNIFFCFLFLFLGFGTLSQPLCSKQDKEVNPLYLEEIKKRFHKELDEHYSRLVEAGSLFEVEKDYFLEKYSDPFIEMYSNPLNKSQKVIYIEYDKNWWGSLYFAVFENQQISKWIAISTYETTINCVRWNKQSFFYQDSTHQGNVTRNTCVFENDSVQCEKEKSGK